MRWKIWGVIVIILSFYWIWQQWPDDKLRVVFCDVGQGDASVVILGSFQALIDTGPSETKLLTCLGNELPFWDREIELVFISHPQKDHNGALNGLTARYKIGKLIEKASNNDIYRYKDLYFDILLGGGEGEKVAGKSTDSENEDSMVIFLSYEKFSALFTADIGEKTELALLDAGVLKNIDLLKVPHHGSKFSSSISFLEELSPELAVVSVGAKNSYGHPNGDTLMRLEGVGAEIIRTDQHGDIEVLYDNGDLNVFTEK